MCSGNNGNCSCPPVSPPFSCSPMGFGNDGCPDGPPPGFKCWEGSKRGSQGHKELRWPQCNFLKPCIDLRVYRQEEWMNEYYSGHIPRDYYRPRGPPDC